MYKVCILAAGYGSRVKPFTDLVNKALLPYNNKAVISHIIEKFDKNAEFVIIVGYKKSSLIDYLTLAHPDIKFTIVDVDDYNIGPGYSLSKAKNVLQCPFYLSTVDCIVDEEIPSLEYDWVGIANHDDSTKYVTVDQSNNLVKDIKPKSANGYQYAYIGLSGIKSYTNFWDNLNDKEFTTAYINLIKNNQRIESHFFNWKDTGCIDEYNKLCTDFDFKNPLYLDELTYIVNNRCVKIITDSIKLNKKLYRKQLIANTPRIENTCDNGFSYLLIEGVDGYKNDKFNIHDIINWHNIQFPIHKSYNLASKAYNFYFNKTIKRLLLEDRDVTFFINFFKDNDLAITCNPSIFHGDFTLSNIIVNSSINLIDWREGFDDDLVYGDNDYDLAKLYMSVLIPWTSIKTGQFSEYNVQYSNLDYERIKEFTPHLTERIIKITGIIMLNMSPLYTNPVLRQLLFNKGKELI